MQGLVNVIFISGICFTISAIGTWLVYLTLMLFDIDKEQAVNKQRDYQIEKVVQENKGNIKELKAKK